MRIDMILLNDPEGHVKVESHRIVRDSGEGTKVYSSDHYPIFTDLSLSLWESLVVQTTPRQVRLNPKS